jgi:hypothetical protein
MQVYQHLFGAGNALVNPEAFFWTISILMSRATSGKQQPFTLIPFFDWFNHSDRGYAAASVASLYSRLVLTCPLAVLYQG